MKITAIGEVLIDLTQNGIDPAGDPVFIAHPGGAPANVAAAAAKLGAESDFVGCVGRDSFGYFLKSALENCGVGTVGLQFTDKASTTIAVVTVKENGEREFSFLRKPGADQLLDENETIASVKDCGILHFGSVSLTNEPSRSSVLAAVRYARQRGCFISYDPNYRAPLWQDEEEAALVMRSVLPMCDIVKLSDEETELMTGLADPEDAAEELCRIGAGLAVVTLGSNGALWRGRGSGGSVEGFRCKVADTIGAGDTFCGAVLSCVAKRGGLEGMTPNETESIIRFANMAASLSVRRPGAIPAMPDYDEVMEALRNEKK